MDFPFLETYLSIMFMQTLTQTIAQTQEYVESMDVVECLGLFLACTAIVCYCYTFYQINLYITYAQDQAQQRRNRYEERICDLEKRINQLSNQLQKKTL